MVTPNPTAASLQRRRRLKWLGGLALVGLLLLGGAWLTRERWLTAMVQAWVVNESVEQADAVLVLGGGSQYRSFPAARMYREGRVPKVLFPDIALSPSDAGQAISRETQLIGRVLTHEGVPPAAQEIIGKAVTSTQDEILALRDWAQRNGAHTIIVPTDPFHTRRLSRLGRKVFANSGVRLVVVAVDTPGYRWQEWWRNEHGVLAFQNEIIKSVLYALR